MTHKIDVLVGERIRQIRQAQGVSQEALAAKIGITYQQLQKYEKAENRISASRLFDLAHALNQTPISLFFNQVTQAPSYDRQTTRLVNEYQRLTLTKKKLLLKLAKEL